MESKHQLDPTLVFFFEIKFFSFPKKSVRSSAFQKKLQRLDQPTLVIVFAFLKKITMTGSSHFLSPNGQALNTPRFLLFFR